MLKYIKFFFKGLPFDSLLQYVTSSVICQALRFAGMIIATHFLRIEEFGFFAQITACIGICGILSGIGHHDGLISYQGTDDRYFRFHLQLSILIGLISIFLLLFVAPLILGAESPVLKFQFLTSAILFVEAIYPSLLISAQKKFKFKFTGIVDLCSVLSWIGVLIFGLFFLKGVELLLWARLAEVSVRLFLLTLQGKIADFNLCFDREVYLYYKTPYFKSVPFRSAIDFLIIRLDILILSHFVTISELGIYERAQHFIQIATSVSVNLIDRVSMMSFSVLQNNKESLKIAFNTSLRYVIITSLSATILITLILPWGLHYFVSKEISESLQRIWYFSTGIAIFKPIAMIVGFLLLGIGESKLLLKQNLLLLIMIFILLIVLVPFYGINGGGIAISLSYLTVGVIQVRGAYQTITNRSM